jgi:hypothetical protein
VRDLDIQDMISFLKGCIGGVATNRIIGSSFFTLDMLGTLKKWNVFMRNINPFLKNSCQE